MTGTSSGNSNSAVNYDEFSRITSLQRKHNETNVVGYTYDYWENDTNTSTQLDTLTITTGSSNREFEKYEYTYDANGNITSIYDGISEVTYYYDDLNQLVRVDNFDEGRIWTYTYDFGGNILNKSEYFFSSSGPVESKLISSVDYTYSTSEWGDLLTGWGDETITNDEIGNMLSDGTWTYTWQHGRQLKSMTSGSTTVSFGYDASGMRTSKTVGNKTWEYVYNGSTLSYMTDGTNKLFFSYDSNGPMSVNYNGTVYYYVQNAQGDIIFLVNSSGAVVVRYSYDAWGKLLAVGGSMSSTLGQVNPLRYRGYVYDTETGLYYLQSRYYNPELYRFISTDDTSVLIVSSSELTDKNLFAYCDNNPISRVDNGGEFWLSVAVGAASGLIGQAVTDFFHGNSAAYKAILVQL